MLFTTGIQCLKYRAIGIPGGQASRRRADITALERQVWKTTCSYTLLPEKTVAAIAEDVVMICV